MSEFPIKCFLLQCCVGETLFADTCNYLWHHCRLTCYFNGLTGLCMMLNVTQTPRNLFLVTGATMNITCSHHDKTYDKIFWYQQSNGQNLEHLGLLSFKQDLVDRKGFSITGDAEKEAYLLVSSVKAEHSAVYFCAVSAARCYRFIGACAQNPSPVT